MYKLCDAVLRETKQLFSLKSLRRLTLKWSPNACFEPTRHSVSDLGFFSIGGWLEWDLVSKGIKAVEGEENFDLSLEVYTHQA